MSSRTDSLAYVEPVAQLNTAFQRFVDAVVEERLASVQLDSDHNGCDCCSGFYGDSVSFADRSGSGLAEVFCAAYLEGLNGDFSNIHLQFILRDATAGFRPEVLDETGFQALYQKVRSGRFDKERARKGLARELADPFEQLHHVSTTHQSGSVRLDVSREDYSGDFPEADTSSFGEGFVALYAQPVDADTIQRIVEATFQ